MLFQMLKGAIINLSIGNVRYSTLLNIVSRINPSHSAETLPASLAIDLATLMTPYTFVTTSRTENTTPYVPWLIVSIT